MNKLYIFGALVLLAVSLRISPRPFEAEQDLLEDYPALLQTLGLNELDESSKCQKMFKEAKESCEKDLKHCPKLIKKCTRKDEKLRDDGLKMKKDAAKCQKIRKSGGKDKKYDDCSQSLLKDTK